MDDMQESYRLVAESGQELGSCRGWPLVLPGRVIFLQCGYEEYLGTMMLSIIISGDMPISIGRERWGEPKKTGTAQVYVDGHEVYGDAERNADS